MTRTAAAPPHTDARSPETAREGFGPTDFVDVWAAAMTLQATLAAECLQFARRRIEAQARLVQVVSESPDVFWALSAQSGFVTAAVDDYQREAETIARRIVEQRIVEPSGARLAA